MKLRKEDAVTLDELKRVVASSWQSNDHGNPEVHDLRMAADVKGWLDGALDDRLRHFTAAHQFLFELKEYHGELRAVMSTKQFANNDEWITVGPVLKVLGHPSDERTACVVKYAFPLAFIACIVDNLPAILHCTGYAGRRADRCCRSPPIPPTCTESA